MDKGSEHFMPAEELILNKLRTELPDNLYYHGVHHTLDVLKSVIEIADSESVTDSHSLLLLKTAALYHDSGFLNTYHDHEEAGCRIVRETLPEYGYDAGDIDIICDMIMATKIPQSPRTHLERMLCDADLDYLGRQDFESTAQTLYAERSVRGLVGDTKEWNVLQVKFLTTHQFWTVSAIRKGEEMKQSHLAVLLKRVQQEGITD